MTSYVLEFPIGIRLINANGRSSRYAVSTQTHFKSRINVKRHLREITAKMAAEQKIPRLGKVNITVTYNPPDNRRRDSPNVLFPSSKVCIDGLVDAGVLRDDNDKWVKSLMFQPGHVIAGGQMVMEITEVDDERLIRKGDVCSQCSRLFE